MDCTIQDVGETSNEEAEGKRCYITTLSNEILNYVCTYLDAKSVTRLCQTCRRLRDGIMLSDPLWKERLRRDLELDLRIKRPFKSFYEIYRLVSMSRTVTKIYLSERFYSSGKYGCLPGWLWTWVILNTTAPELPTWIRNHREAFLRVKVSEMPLGRIQRVWNLAAGDFSGIREVRNERGTIYYSWSDVHRVFFDKYGGLKELIEHSLKRCSRAKRHLERSFTQLTAPEEMIAQNQSGQTFVAVLPQDFFNSTCGFHHLFQPLWRSRIKCTKRKELKKNGRKSLGIGRIVVKDKAALGYMFEEN